MSRVDVVVFGASGFTGKYCVEEIVKILKVKEPFTWGVAGRGKEKLEQVLAEVGKKYEVDLQNIPVFIADVKDEASLNAMAASARVIINCCGPFIFYGEPVVKACVENKTHHVDVSGEPRFLERTQLNYHEKAKDAGVYVVGSCGFDSIPADLGVVFFKNQFKGDVNSIETYLESWVKGGLGGANGIHYGTWESAVNGVANADELRSLRRSLYPNRLPVVGPKLKNRFAIHKNEFNKWSLPFPGADKSVVTRSQYYFLENEKHRPVQVNTYMSFPNLLAAMIVALVGSVFALFAKFEYGRRLLLSYPKLFSCGMASHEGPSEKQMENTLFSITFIGTGWDEKLSEPTDKHATPPEKKMITKVSGTNPGYGATCVMLIISALTIIRETDKLPEKGGVYPPGAAFAKTSLIEQLNEHGVKFEVISRE